MKREMMKKVFAIVLVCAFMFSFAACGNKSNEAAAQTSTAEAATTASTDAPTTAPAVTEPTPKDLGGYEFTLMSDWAQQWIGSTDDGVSEYNEKFLAQVAEVEKNYNCKINIVKTGDWTGSVEKATTAINAGQKYCDFLDSTALVYYPLKKNGLLEDLAAISTYDPNNSVWKTIPTQLATEGSKVYGVFNENTDKSGLFVNTSMLKRLNLEPIYDLIKKNEWTWDKFKEYCVAATKDTNNDGKNDSYGIIPMDESLAMAVVNSNGTMPIIKGADGKYIFNGQDPKCLAGVQLYADLFQTLKVVAPRPEGDWDAAINAFRDTPILFFPYNDWIVDGYLNEMKDDFGFVPFPKGPDTDTYHSFISGFRVFSMPLNRNVDEREKAMIILNAIFKEIPGYEYKSRVAAMETEKFRDSDSFKNYLMLNDVADLNYVYISDQTFSDAGWMSAMDAVAKGDKTPAAAMEAIKDAMQSKVNEKLN